MRQRCSNSASLRQASNAAISYHLATLIGIVSICIKFLDKMENRVHVVATPGISCILAAVLVALDYRIYRTLKDSCLLPAKNPLEEGTQ